jgi:hypothetical protein
MISSIGSTSSIGTGLRFCLKRMSPRKVAETLVVVIDHSREGLEGIVVAGPDRLLEGVDGLGIEQVVFPVTAPLIHSTGIKGGLLVQDAPVGERLFVTAQGFLGQSR